MYAIPGGILLASAGVTALSARHGRPAALGLATAATIALMAHGLVRDLQDWRAVAWTIADNRGPDDLIVHCVALAHPALRHAGDLDDPAPTVVGYDVGLYGEDARPVVLATPEEWGIEWTADFRARVLRPRRAALRPGLDVFPSPATTTLNLSAGTTVWGVRAHCDEARAARYETWLRALDGQHDVAFSAADVTLERVELTRPVTFDVLVPRAPP